MNHMNKLRLQIKTLFLLILLNFIVQIPYFIHLYYSPQHPFPNSKGASTMSAVFALFVTGYILFMKRKKAGYWLLIIFLSAEFLFYLLNFMGTLIHGYRLFFQIYNPDLILRFVYTVGYVNLFASGYFLFLLLYKKIIYSQNY